MGSAALSVVVARRRARTDGPSRALSRDTHWRPRLLSSKMHLSPRRVQRAQLSSAVTHLILDKRHAVQLFAMAFGLVIPTAFSIARRRVHDGFCVVTKTRCKDRVAASSGGRDSQILIFFIMFSGAWVEFIKTCGHRRNGRAVFCCVFEVGGGRRGGLEGLTRTNVEVDARFIPRKGRPPASAS